MGFSLLIGFVGTIIVSLPSVPVLGLMGFSQSAWPYIILVGALATSLSIWIGYTIFDSISPLRCGPGGICTFNGFGITTRVQWKEIEDAKSIPFGPGLRYAYLKHGRNFLTAAYVPLYLRDYEGFKAAVLEYAGPEHPLLKVL